VAGFLNGPGFARMRDYLRRTADAIWVVDCSPEGHQPEVATRIFQGVQQPVCIVLAVRDGTTGPDVPAPVRFATVTGARHEKFVQLKALTLKGPGWVAGADGWSDPLLPAGADTWTSLPALDDLLAWSGSGMMPGRTWVSGPSPAVLRARWQRLIAAPRGEKAALLDEHKTDRTITTVLSDNLPGYPARAALAEDTGPCPDPVRIGYRSFDRQWIIPDKRLINRPNPGLWQVRTAPEQLYLTTVNRTAPTPGPATTATALVPDLHHFHGRGGRAFPLWLDAAATKPNLVPGLLDHLAGLYGTAPAPTEVFAYLAALLASPAYVATYAADLATPGLRVPLTADAALFAEAVALGAQVLWLHAYGERFGDPAAGRPVGPPRLPPGRRPLVNGAIPHDEAGMPEVIAYDPATCTLAVGAGRITPVEPAVWAYEVSGMRVVKRWFDRRKKDPDGRRSSPLDGLVPTTWDPAWTTELLELLNVLTLLVDLEPAQADLLDRIAAGPLVTVADLTTAGLLPVTARPTIEQPLRRQAELFGA